MEAHDFKDLLSFLECEKSVRMPAEYHTENMTNVTFNIVF
jgi:hypothetical protein